MPGLIFFLIRLQLQKRARARVVAVFFIVSAIVLSAMTMGRVGCAPETRELRVATFNIENFPKHPEQARHAFALIERLEVPIVAVQEITDPAAFTREAHARLGEHWRFVHRPEQTQDISGERPIQFLGVLYDSDHFTALDTALHDDTRIEGRGKPTLEVRLANARGEGALRLLVVHLKSGSNGRPQRARQMQGMRQIIARVQEDGTPLVVLGDFNATGPSDHNDLATIAEELDMHWSSADLPCTAYWQRLDGCATSNLDHVLTWRPPSDVRITGACATQGCKGHDHCPIYRHDVSDHCPIVGSLPWDH